jgi:predicted glycosyltransferase involved in capsule biosynthesis
LQGVVETFTRAFSKVLSSFSSAIDEVIFIEGTSFLDKNLKLLYEESVLPACSILPFNFGIVLL